MNKSKLVLPLLLLVVVPYANGAIFQSESCGDSEALVSYQIHLVTNWSKNLFPKHYPEFRPPPQWSMTYGQTHNASFHLFRLNDYAPTPIRIFAESGHAHALEEDLTRKNAAIYDEFHLPKVSKGQGATGGTFFVDGSHSKVSFITKIVPSPDWFIGLDSYNLCSAGRWVENATIALDPLDAGTSNGLTFTSPKWPTNPPNVIERITARYPKHFASSFFYPEIKHLPSIAQVTFTKLQEYHGSNNVHKKMKKLKMKQRNKFLKKMAHLNRKLENETSKQNNDCQVSAWSEWSACSQSCDIGKRTRTRVIVSHPKDHGKDCPRLKDTQWCGSARECSISDNYFRW
ncbi:spondin-2 [Toxorhynchites rutilus septentrionalis]|uniref:spondin-2 n=1 Tax=Toxorhynchites rutilus septentrionalis TaxID=329112 RepID=UPI00247A4796|nr:spondin-2 [Toxorhynchites rutilus septentrionalis]